MQMPPGHPPDRNLSWLSAAFASYYQRAGPEPPPRIARREFAFTHYGMDGMHRPLAFRTPAEMRSYLAHEAPSNAYYSTAYYEDPSVPMEYKEWLGADLVFDLDADHLKGAEALSHEEMLRRVKEEFIKLVERFLMGVFGFAAEDIEAAFSGSRGYHAHIRSGSVLSLESRERRELVNFITGTGLDTGWFFREKRIETGGRGFRGAPGSARVLNTPSRELGGWYRLLHDGIIETVTRWKAGEKDEVIEELASVRGIGAATAGRVYSHLFVADEGVRADRIIAGASIDLFPDGTTTRAFERFIVEKVGVNLYGETDVPVTTDVRRIIRLPGTLHGKSGLAAKPLEVDGLKDFEPLRDAVVFGGEQVAVTVAKELNFTLGGEAFHLQPGAAEVPLFAAVYLVARREAVVAGG